MPDFRIAFIFALAALAAFGQSGAGSIEAQSASYKLALVDAAAPRTEFWGGKDYRNITFSSNLPKNLSIKGQYFGVMHGDVGTTGLTRRWEPRDWFSAYGGGGIIFGRGEPAGPAALAGFEVERFGLTVEAKLVQGFRHSAEANRDRYFQTSLGRQHGAWWLGGCTEFLHHREEREWSGGPCTQWAVRKTGLFFGTSLFFSGHGAPSPVFGIGFNPALRRE